MTETSLRTLTPVRTERPIAVSQPLVPVHLHYRAAQVRVIAAFGGVVGTATAMAELRRCLDELHRMGLSGRGLIVAAEHMASFRLRELTEAAPVALAIAKQEHTEN